MPRRTVLLLSGLVLVGCATVQEGPPVNVPALAVPDVVLEAAKAHPPPPAPEPTPPPPVLRGGFKAWIPQTVTPNGDVVAGHYVEVSDAPPPKELIQPDYVIPRAPKQIYRPQPRSPGAGRPVLPPAQISPVPQALPPLPGGSAPRDLLLPQEGGYDPVLP